jgi:hypothetical protein
MIMTAHHPLQDNLHTTQQPCKSLQLFSTYYGHVLKSRFHEYLQEKTLTLIYIKK